MKGNLTLLATVFVLALAFNGTATAGIIYSANDSVGVGSVVGSIETDGVLGTLLSSDFLDWNLTVYDGSGTATLLGPLSGNNSSLYIGGSNNVSATSTALIFDFNGNGGFMNIFDPSTCSPPEWSFSTTGSGSGCNGTTGNEWGVAAVLPIFTGTYSQESGPVVFATTATLEPSYAWEVCLALIGVLGFVRIRRGYSNGSGRAA